jgi:hypothetical protein
VVAQQIGQNLAFINWVVLTGLAVGCFAVVILGRFRVGATKGFLTFASFCAAAFGFLAYLSDTALPSQTTAGSPITPDPAFEAMRRTALLAFSVLALVYTVVMARGGRAPILAALTAAAGGLAIVAGSLGWGGGFPAALPLLLQLIALALVTGGVFGAMILGHWYLVTPKLPEQPLVTLARILFVLVALQLVLFVVSMALGAGLGGPPFSELTGDWALFVWLRLLIGLVFPLAVSWAAIQTAKTRSMESATGLLYIDVGAIAAGTILAAGLYFGAGMIA